MDNFMKAFGRPTKRERARMAGLGAPLSAGGFLDDRLGRLRGIGGWGQGGVGGILSESFFKLAQAGFQQGHALLQLSDQEITLLTTRAERRIHVANIAKRREISCASFLWG